jgi:ATP-dependent DNA helicase DinG
VAATSGVEVGPGRLAALARITRGILADDDLVTNLEAAAARLRADLAEERGRRIRRMAGEPLADALVLARQRVEAVIAALRKIPDDAKGDAPARKLRAMGAAGHLVADIDMALEQAGPDVVWVEGTEEYPVLRVAPVDVAEVLQTTLWGTAGEEPADEADADPDDHRDNSQRDDSQRDDDQRDDRGGRSRRTVVFTSATIPLRLGPRLGLDEADFDELDVGSPFDYEDHGLLYCAAHLPDPRSARYEEELHAELRDLIQAAGGRTLALFTSWRAMDAAADALADELPGPLLTQRDLPKPALVAAFTADPTASLFATMGFWQGIDVPGETLSLVTIDRLPFPRPDEPLLQARRELARQAAFATVDLPRAATLLAQGAGRLIRNATDRGVVAVLDPRLATANYRWDLVRALPPFRRTKEKDEALAFLEGLPTATKG